MRSSIYSSEDIHTYIVNSQKYFTKKYFTKTELSQYLMGSKCPYYYSIPAFLEKNRLIKQHTFHSKNSLYEFCATTISVNDIDRFLNFILQRNKDRVIKIPEIKMKAQTLKSINECINVLISEFKKNAVEMTDLYKAFRDIKCPYSNQMIKALLTLNFLQKINIHQCYFSIDFLNPSDTNHLYKTIRKIHKNNYKKKSIMRIENPRNINIQVKVTNPELIKIEDFCKNHNYEKSEFIRKCIFEYINNRDSTKSAHTQKQLPILNNQPTKSKNLNISEKILIIERLKDKPDIIDKLDLIN